MDNFNLRYECLDAHDDFHAQMRQGVGVVGSWNENACKELDKMGPYYEGDGMPLPEDIVAVSDVIGSREKRCQSAISVMTGIIQ